MSKIIAVDLGNYNIKTSEGVIFQSRFKEVNDEFSNNGCFEFEGKLYEMEVGSFDNTYNKAEKNYLPNLMYAFYKSIETAAEQVNLVLGVPASNLGIKDNFKDELEGKTFEFGVDEDKKIVTIDKVATVAEGLSSFYTLRKEQRAKDTIIIDIGGRTVNVCVFINNKCVDKFTIPFGMINLYDHIAENYNSKGNNATTEEVIRLIKNRDLRGDKEKEEFVLNMLNSIKLRVNKIETYNIYVTGGGSLELDTQLRDNIKDYESIPNPLFSNVYGNKAIAELKWK